MGFTREPVPHASDETSRKPFANCTRHSRKPTIPDEDLKSLLQQVDDDIHTLLGDPDSPDSHADLLKEQIDELSATFAARYPRRSACSGRSSQPSDAWGSDRRANTSTVALVYGHTALTGCTSGAPARCAPSAGNMAWTSGGAAMRLARSLIDIALHHVVLTIGSFERCIQNHSGLHLVDGGRQRG